MHYKKYWHQGTVSRINLIQCPNVQGQLGYSLCFWTSIAHQYHSPLSLAAKIFFDNAIENRYMGLFTAVQSEDIKLFWAPQNQRWPGITYLWTHEPLHIVIRGGFSPWKKVLFKFALLGAKRLSEAKEPISWGSGGLCKLPSGVQGRSPGKPLNLERFWALYCILLLT